MTGERLQAFIDKLDALGESLSDAELLRDIGPGLYHEALYLVAACRQRFPDRFPGNQRPLVFPAGTVTDSETELP